MGNNNIAELLTLTQFTFSLFFFFYFFFRIGTKMNLLISISILCFVSLVAGTPGSGGVKADVAGEPLEKKKTARMLFGSALGARKMDEANRQADERLLKDYAKVEISRDNRETCIKEGRG